ncbi:MAG: squalene--hopene cyclase [Phormidesmis sp.]
MADSDTATSDKADASALTKAGEWLLEKQIIDYGDWAVKNPHGRPGGWAFEFENRFYPDVDDTAVVVMALAAIALPNESLKQAAISRGVDWVASMQCKTGGWAAFGIDNDQDWLNAMPYGDLKAMIDPSTADITARVIEMQARLPLDDTRMSVRRITDGLRYLIEQQESDGSWFGRWGVNYIYGTSGALAALSLIDPKRYQHEILRGALWLVGCQNDDGGWGETCESYNNPKLKGQGNSTASQSAWALLGLIDATDCLRPAKDFETKDFETKDSNAKDLEAKAQCDIQKALETGIQYLLNTQKEDGSWAEIEHTGTGFPGHFYLRYHLYPQVFPLMALGRYRAIASAASVDIT